MDLEQAKWRISSFSQGGGQCVEVAWPGAVRDSKNPAGPVLLMDLGALVDAAKRDRPERQ